MLIRAVPAQQSNISRNPCKGHELYKMLGNISVTLIGHDKRTKIAQETHDTHDGRSGIT